MEGALRLSPFELRGYWPLGQGRRASSGSIGYGPELRTHQAEPRATTRATSQPTSGPMKETVSSVEPGGYLDFGPKDPTSARNRTARADAHDAWEAGEGGST